MKQIFYSPESKADLLQIKNTVLIAYGENVSEQVMRKIVNSIHQLEISPLSGVDISKIYEIDCDYRYVYSQKNYVFYRIEGDYVKIIRVLNEKQDFLRTLFGINTTQQETEDYWDE